MQVLQHSLFKWEQRLVERNLQLNRQLWTIQSSYVDWDIRFCPHLHKLASIWKFVWYCGIAKLYLCGPQAFLIHTARTKWKRVRLSIMRIVSTLIAHNTVTSSCHWARSDHSEPTKRAGDSCAWKTEWCLFTGQVHLCNQPNMPVDRWNPKWYEFRIQYWLMT